jgi:hypothetical protein
MSDCVQTNSAAPSRSAVVMAQQPAEESPAANVARPEQACIIQDGIRSIRPRGVFRWAGRIELHARKFRNGAIPQALVRPMGIVKVDILPFDMIEMAKAETHEMVQAFPLERADPRFHERVGVRR